MENSVLRIFGSPQRYVQGPGALDQLGLSARPYGANPVLVGDTHVMTMLGDRLRGLCEAEGLEPLCLTLEGEITRAAISELKEQLGGRDVSLVIGVGGGKSLDAAKALAVLIEKPVFTVPTIASNDSPTSAAIAMYDDNHVMIAVDRMEANPDLVLRLRAGAQLNEPDASTFYAAGPRGYIDYPTLTESVTSPSA